MRTRRRDAPGSARDGDAREPRTVAPSPQRGGHPPLSQVPPRPPSPHLRGSLGHGSRDPEAARLPKETDASAELLQALATGPPAPPPPGAAGHDGTVVPGEGLAPGGGGAGTTIPTGPTAAASLRPSVGLLVS